MANPNVMIFRLRILTLLLTLSCMTVWAEPALAARLAEISGEADATEARESAEFKLGDQTQVQINYNITKRADGCSVHVRIYREQNGRWLVADTVVRTNDTKRGDRSLTLPAGSYRIEVVAKHARYVVSVDKD